MTSSSFKSSSFDTSEMTSRSFPFANIGRIIPAFIDSAEEIEMNKKPLPISPEYDMIREKYFSDTKIDRSHWVARLLEEHPEIKELRDTVLPLDRAIEFGRLYLPDERLIKHSTLLALISQHLRTLGLIESQSSLYSEWDGPYDIPPNLDHSQLMILLQRGVLHAERFWELTMPGTMSKSAEVDQVPNELSKIIGVLQAKKGSGGKRLIEERDEGPELINGAMRYPTINQIIWICTTDSPFRTEQFVSAVTFPYLAYFDPQIYFEKIQERFEIAFTENEHFVDLTMQLLISWFRNSQPLLGLKLANNVKKYVMTEIRSRYPTYCDKFFEGIKPTPIEPINYEIAPPVEIGEEPYSLWVGEFNLLSLTPKEFGRQLTIYLQNIFFKIHSCELIDNAWDSEKLHSRAPNVVFQKKVFDKIIRWLAYSILIPPQGMTNVDMYNYVLKVCKECFDFQSYEACAIICLIFESFLFNTALEEQGDSRLVRTMNDIKNELLASNSCFKSGFEMCERAKQGPNPCLPFLHVYTKKIATFVEGYVDSVKAGLSSGSADIKVITEVYSMVSKVEEFKKRRFHFFPIDQAQEAFAKLPMFTDDYVHKVKAEVKAQNTSI